MYVVSSRAKAQTTQSVATGSSSSSAGDDDLFVEKVVSKDLNNPRNLIPPRAKAQKTQSVPTGSSSSSAGDDNLFVEKVVSKDLNNPPKEELFRLLRVKGHRPIQRSIRAGNICVKCNVCLGECRASTYRTDAWKVSSVSDVLGRQCGKRESSSVSDGFVSSDAGKAKKAPKTAADQFSQTVPILTTGTDAVACTPPYTIIHHQMLIQYLQVLVCSATF